MLLLRAQWDNNVAYFRTEEEFDNFVKLNGLEKVDGKLNWVLIWLRVGVAENLATESQQFQM